MQFIVINQGRSSMRDRTLIATGAFGAALASVCCMTPLLVVVFGAVGLTASERIVPDAKEYIAETIDNPEATYDPKIWGAPGFALVVSWLAQKWRQRCQKLAPRGSKDPEQYLTKEQQKACLDLAAVELIREITQRRSLN
jgi:hypothetical protein